MKVLVVRFSSIGDIILTTPVVRCLAKQQDVEVHYLTKSGFRPILEANPYIHRIHTIDKGTHEVMDVLKQEDFDHVIDLHHNLRTLILKLQLGKPARSFNKINIQKWLIVNLKIDRLPKRHIVDRYLDTVEHLGIENDGDGMDYFIPQSDLDWVSAFVAGQGIQQYICISVGAAHETKCLTIEQLVEICSQLTLPVLLLGGTSEMEKSGQIMKTAGAHVFDLCGKIDLNKTAACISGAELIVSHDTGVMHMAAALRKPILSVWGNTIPEFGMYPYYGENESLEMRMEVMGLACRPCSKIGFDACPKGHFKCIRGISPMEIARQVKRQLSR